ncbi:hypothetical protein ACLMJK_003530 [Lecanora helva]
MATHWFPQGQQNHQYQQQSQPPPQSPYYPQAQPFQQPQYQQSHQYPQTQYQQTPQTISHPQNFQQEHYPPVQQSPHAQTSQQPSYYYPNVQQQHAHPQQLYVESQQQPYNGNYQQFAHQQRFSQQHSPTPYPTSTQQYQQQQPNSVQGQLNPPSNAVSCFNCGAPSHMAQNCPEPKRKVPVGALDPRKYTNPLKRVKSGGTVITKYGPPPNSAQAQVYSPGYSPPKYGFNAQSQYQGPLTPSPASTAGYDASHQQAWHQYYQWQAYQQNQQQLQPQDASYQAQYHATLPSPNTSYVNRSQQSNQMSHAAPSGQVSHVQPPQIKSSQTHTTAPQHPVHTPNSQHSQVGGASFPLRQQSTSSVSMESQSTPPSARDTLAHDLEDDDLNLLDVPDLPNSQSEHGKTSYIQGTTLSAPACLINMPLPANFIVADALYPIPPPDPGQEGRCQSKYLRDVTIESLCGNIQGSKYWKDHKDDTAFLALLEDETVIPIDEVRAELAKRHAGRGEQDAPDRQKRSLSIGVATRKDSMDVLTKMEKLERDIAEMKAKLRKKSQATAEQAASPLVADQASPKDADATVEEKEHSPPPSITAENEATCGQNTENIVAALGVTGSPKPTVAADETQKDLQNERSHSGKEYSAQQRHDVGINAASVSYSPQSRLPLPPPPPPPPYQHSPWPEQDSGSPGSIGRGHADGFAFESNGTAYGNGHHNTGLDGGAISPNESRYHESTARKRSYTRRDSSSDEEDTRARRQEDDFTPKLKRRQPQVNAAYGRRW